MRRPPAFPLTCAWGAVCGAILGGLRTREAALHLLAKGRALEAAGMPGLPGPSHWGVLASWRPAGAGALFFGLGLGLGWGALAALLAAAARRTGRGGRLGLAAAAALPALWAAAARDGGLAAALLALGAGAALLAGPPAPPAPRRALLGGACFALACLGLLPWLLAPEGAFTRLRDRWLLAPGPGLTVSEFYYRWTLYPAEALKDLGSLSQPVADTSLLSAEAARRFAEEALALRVLCVRGAPGAGDFAAVAGAEGLELVFGKARVPWPADPSRRREAWLRFARAADGSAALRAATALGLFWGCPLGLAWAVGAGCLRGAERLSPGRPARALGLAAALALGLGAAGWPTGRVARLRALREPADLAAAGAALRAADPAERFHAARGAERLGAPAEPLLLAALDDPVLSVRYAAAAGLGAAGAAAARAALWSSLRGKEEWYVKERAYGALWRLGWRPAIP